MRCRGDHRYGPQNLDIGYRMVEIVVADDTTEWFTACRVISVFIKPFENRTLIPCDTFVFFLSSGQFLFGDVVNADFQLRTDLCVPDKIIYAAPNTFQ